MKGYNYLEFPPGTNIWKKSARLLALNFERLGVLGGVLLSDLYRTIQGVFISIYGI